MQIFSARFNENNILLNYASTIRKTYLSYFLCFYLFLVKLKNHTKNKLHKCFTDFIYERGKKN